jgi:uncharacterized phage protein gp47/JayE
MVFRIPSLADCVASARAGFRAYLPGTDAWLWPNNVGPSAKVIGGSVWEVFNRLDYVQRAKFALTAQGPDLDAHGSEIGLARKLALPASGNVVVTTAAAMTIAAGAQFQRLDGVVFTASTGGSATAAGTFSVVVVAAAAALAGNTQAGTALTIISGAGGVGAATATAAVDANGLTGGLDPEPDGAPYTSDVSTFRGRILFRKRNPFQGGAPADYVSWATQVPGVTRVFVERLYNGAGTIRIFPMFDAIFAATGGVADTAHVALVQTAIAQYAPGDAQILVQAPTAQPIAVTVQGLVPNSSVEQAAVEAELLDAFQRLGRVAGNDTATAAMLAAMPFLATPFSFAALWCAQAVANAAGDNRGVMIAPTSDVTIATACVPTLGTVTFE